MTVITMSEKEVGRLRVLIEVADGKLSVADAESLLALGRRQIFRLQAVLRDHGAAGLVSKKRGRRSNRAHGETFKRTVIDIVTQHYGDFGPTLAAEKLAEVHQLPVGVETLRQWMIEAGLWTRRRDRPKRIHQPRLRRESLGELIQIDGCKHYWFEDRGPQTTLLVFIDDATSRLMQLSFAASENAFSYFQATRDYIERHGKPVAFYSDRHSIFRVARTGAVGGTGMTQFGRGLHELAIDIMCANSPQAKGRVERAHKTLQDRLVKELRLAGVSDAEQANALLPAFIEHYNARFARVPASSSDAHRPLGAHDDIDFAFCWREQRSVSKNLTLQYDKVLFLLDDSPVARTSIGKQVTVCDYPDGRIEVRWQGVPLTFRIFDKIRQVRQAAIVENKHLDAALEMARQLQAQMPAQRRSSTAPRRSDQQRHMFAVG